MTAKTERIEARFPAELKSLAERAALASGYSLTDYLAHLVRNDAPQRLKTQNEILLNIVKTAGAKCQDKSEITQKRHLM